MSAALILPLLWSPDDGGRVVPDDGEGLLVGGAQLARVFPQRPGALPPAGPGLGRGAAHDMLLLQAVFWEEVISLTLHILILIISV